MAETDIEWCDRVWNVVRGCSRVSRGCGEVATGGCYAERMAHRFSGEGMPYEGLTRLTAGGPRWTGEVRCVPALLDDPLSWKKPQRVFVNSMGDLFHEKVPDSFIMRVWLRMAATPRHTFIILTKRAERMRRWVERWSDTSGDIDPQLARGPAAVRAAHTSGRALMFAEMLETMGDPPPGCAFPTYDWMEGPRWLPAVLGNVVLGVSIEDQPSADARVAHLLATAAATRAVSCEPLLGAIDLRHVEGDTNALDPNDTGHESGGVEGWVAGPAIGWVICGGQTGPGSAPMHPAWVRSLRDQCEAHHVPFFFKSWGDWMPHPDGAGSILAEARGRVGFQGLFPEFRDVLEPAPVRLLCLGKKRTGRELDGRTWGEFPGEDDWGPEPEHARGSCVP